MMEEVDYIRVCEPLPGGRETCSPMDDCAAELATALYAVRAGSNGADLRQRVQLRLAANLASSCNGRASAVSPTFC